MQWSWFLIVHSNRKSTVTKIGDAYQSFLVWQLACRIGIKQIQAHYSVVDDRPLINCRHNLFAKACLHEYWQFLKKIKGTISRIVRWPTNKVTEYKRLQNENVTGTNQWAWRRGIQTLQNRENKTKNREVWSTVTVMHVQGPSTAKCFVLTAYHKTFSLLPPANGETMRETSWRPFWNPHTSFMKSSNSQMQQQINNPESGIYCRQEWNSFLM